MGLLGVGPSVACDSKGAVLCLASSRSVDQGHETGGNGGISGSQGLWHTELVPVEHAVVVAVGIEGVGEVEVHLLPILQSVVVAVGVERVGAEDDFFELGGHSLLALQVIARVRDAFSVELPLRRLFEESTVEALSAVLAELVTERIEELPDDEAARLLAELEEAS